MLSCSVVAVPSCVRILHSEPPSLPHSLILMDLQCPTSQSEFVFRVFHRQSWPEELERPHSGPSGGSELAALGFKLTCPPQLHTHVDCSASLSFHSGPGLAGPI